MKCMYKVITVITLCTGAWQVFAGDKPIKVKMIKTDPESRGKPWKYAVADHKNQRPQYKTIKRDATISVVPDSSLTICTDPSNTDGCKSHTVPKDITKSDVIEIDQKGDISVKKKEDKVAKTGAKINLVKVWVLIPISQVKIPFSIQSAHTETGDVYIDNSYVLSAKTTGTSEEQYYVVPLIVEKVARGEQNKGSFVSINYQPRQRIVIKDTDEINNGSRIQMRTSEGIFFVL